ncbi:MAG: arginyltransferase [Betaproteobacteria bacterium]|nr:arginyltransferase [Betaproteobacteria bacterium]
MTPSAASPSELQFYVTEPYQCSYMPDSLARSRVFVPTHKELDREIYSHLLRAGFRRSGLFAYRPCCDACSACVPARLPVERLLPDRAQRRAWQRHQELTAREGALRYEASHYHLYGRYQAARHPGGGMDEDNGEQYAQFLLASSVDTRLVEFHEGDTLRMVSIIDFVADGLSSVYTFFDPAVPGSAYGVYNILWQARLCRSLGLPYLYLGYWVRESRKMAYKAKFRPLQGFMDGVWREMSEAEISGRGRLPGQT